MTRFRYQADQTDYIVVDTDFFGQTSLDQLSSGIVAPSN